MDDVITRSRRRRVNALRADTGRIRRLKFLKAVNGRVRLRDAL